MTTSILTPEQLLAERMQALLNIYQRSDRVLTGERLTIEAVEAGADVPIAWTDGNVITINTTHLPRIDASTIVTANGVNAHELAHVLFTPRKGTALMGWVISEGYMRAFNILEDQRIESLMLGLYPSAAPWYTTAVLDWVLAGGPSDLGYLFVRGRRYLPGDLRGGLRATFKRQDLLPEVDRIVDTYRRLIFPTDYDVARDLIRDFHNLIVEATGSNDPQPGCPHGHGKRGTEVLESGRPKGINEQRRANARMSEGEPESIPEPQAEDEDDDLDDQSGWGDEDLDDEDDDLFGSGFGDDDDLDGEDDDLDGAGAGEDDEDLDESESGEAGQSGNADSDSQSEPADGASSGGSSDSDAESDLDADLDDVEAGPRAGEGGEDLADLVKETAKKALQDVLQRKDIRDDIRRTQRQVTGADGSDIIDKDTWSDHTPLPEYAVQYRSLSSLLERLRQQAEPGWNTRQSQGRINPVRWHTDRDVDTAFDLWDEGVHDAMDLEVVILLDDSQSMDSVFEQACNAMWVVKRALDNIGANTTVISFSSTSRTLYHRKDKADAHRIRYSFHRGGTQPVEGLAQAGRIFARSQRTQKILIVFTDGDWGRGTFEGMSAEQYIERMNASGVTTALGFIADPDWVAQHALEMNTHKCRIGHSLDVTGLVPFMRDVVTTEIKKRLIGR